MIVSVGIDVGKASCSIALRDENARYTESSFPNALQGVQACIAFLKAKGVSSETPLVLESTGDYHLLFTMTLRDAHFRGIKVINAILTKKYQKSKIRIVKTDTIDAKILADIALLEDLPTFIQTKDQIIQKKRISLLRQLQKAHQQLQASLKSCQETVTVLYLGISTNGVQGILKTMEKEMNCLQDQIVDAEKNPLVEELGQIPGVSEQAAAIIVSLLGGKLFHSREKLVAFAGLDLRVRESGTSIHGVRHLSKRGDPFLRKKLFQTAWALKMHNQRYHDYYLKKRREGHHYYTCILAVARKFLHHLYALQKKLSQNNLPSLQPQPVA